MGQNFGGAEGQMRLPNTTRLPTLAEPLPTR